MVERVGFNSTALQGATYDAESEELTISFKSGGQYSYSGVPEEVFEQLKNADSPGSFYYQSIKGVY